jgi:replicative DNA helicase
LKDRLPPHSPEAEMAVLGCCLTDPPACIPEAQTVITSDAYFYDERHKAIWTALSGLELRDVNIITANLKLKDGGSCDLMDYLTKCVNAVHSTAHLPAWLDELQDKAARRRLLAITGALMRQAYDCADVTELLDQAEREILSIRPAPVVATEIKPLIQDAIGRIEWRVNNPNQLSGFATGLTDLDKLTDGVHGGEFIVVAGFPSTGKTALAVNIATHCALAGTPSAIFTAEMLPVQIVVRQICAEARANYKRVLESDSVNLVNAAGRLSKAPMHIQPANGLTIGQVQAMARRLKHKHNIRVIVVDYIQLLTGQGDNREQQISNISKGLKHMALELDCAVLGLSQLTDDGKLRESRAIGQDADSVWKLLNDGEWQPLIQPVRLLVEKCRDGETGHVMLTFRKAFTRFESQAKVSDEDIPPYGND